MIYVFYGKGGGKTIAALGLALRARGQGQKDTGEVKIKHVFDRGIPAKRGIEY